MPTYVYEPDEGQEGCSHCRVGLEVRHGMNEPGPAQCPQCGARLRRRITAPGIGGRWTAKSTLSDANLKRHGFKKFINEGEGRFRGTT